MGLIGSVLLLAFCSFARAGNAGAYAELQALAASPSDGNRAFDGRSPHPEAAPEAASATPSDDDAADPSAAPPTPIVKPNPPGSIPPRLKEEAEAEGRFQGGLWGLGGGALLGLLAAILIGGPWGVAAGLAVAALGYYAGRRLGEIVADQKVQRELDQLKDG